ISLPICIFTFYLLDALPICEDETESVCSIRFSSFSRFIVSSSPLPAHAASKNNPEKIRSNFFFISYLFSYWTCLVGRKIDSFQRSEEHTSELSHVSISYAVF